MVNDKNNQFYKRSGVILKEDFYHRADVVQIARELLGKFLVTRIGGKLTAGMINEVEAYAGEIDRASHAFGGRRTARTEVMYRKGGTAYVYLCYGIHSLFNVVTHREGVPHAVLIRGILPVHGIRTMMDRTGKDVLDERDGIGPGKVTALLGIHYSLSGLNLTKKPDSLNEPGIWIENRGIQVTPQMIETSSRIGIGYAGEHAALPYRFRIR